jgi:AsmA family protein
MRLMKRVFVGLLALVLVVVAAVAALAVVAIFVIDPDDYRAEIAKELESLTGRKVTFSSLDLSISLHPGLVVNDVTFANADWGSRKDMASIKRLELEAALMPLFHGELQFQSIGIDGADVILETNKDGKGNWALGSGDGSGGGSVEVLNIDSVEMSDSTITYHDGASGNERVVTITKANLESDSLASTMTVDIVLAVKEGSGTIQGTIDSVASLMSGKETEVDLTVTTPNISTTAKGTIGAISGETPFDLVTSLDVGSLGLVQSLGITDLPFEGPLSFSGHLTGVPDKLKIEDFKLALAGTNMTGTLSADISSEVPSFSGDLSADTIDLGKWIGEDDTTQGDGQNDKLFSDDTIPVEWMDDAELDLNLKVASLTAVGLVFDNVSGTVKLASSKLTVSPFSLGVTNSTVDGAFSLDGGASPVAASLQLNSKGFDMGALLKQSNVTEMLTGTADVDVDVQGAGASTAAIMAALNGKVSMVMTDGSISEHSLDLFLGGSKAIIGGLFEEDKSSAKLTCLAAAWDVKDGIADQSVMLIDTQYSTLTGKGSIDLGKETIDETLTPHAKGVSLNLAVPVDITGTLTNPKATPDEGTLAVKIGSLIGSVFFPPALLLGLGDVGIGANHPCVIANTPGQDSSNGISTGDVVDGAGKVVDDAAGAVGSALEDVGKGLDSLLGD